MQNDIDLDWLACELDHDIKNHAEGLERKRWNNRAMLIMHNMVRKAKAEIAAKDAALAEMHRRYNAAKALLKKCWDVINKPSWADGDTFDVMASEVSEFLAIDKLEEEIEKDMAKGG